MDPTYLMNPEDKKIVFHITYNPAEVVDSEPILSALTIAHLDTIVSFTGPGISWSFPLRAIKSMQIEVFPDGSPIPDQRRMPNESNQSKGFDKFTQSITPIYDLDI